MATARNLNNKRVYIFDPSVVLCWKCEIELMASCSSIIYSIFGTNKKIKAYETKVGKEVLKFNNED